MQNPGRKFVCRTLNRRAAEDVRDKINQARAYAKAEIHEVKELVTPEGPEDTWYVVTELEFKAT
jgi:hypothetical protein